MNFFISFIFLCEFVNAQTYDSLVKPGKMWNHICRHGETFTIKLKDSLVYLNGKSYYRLISNIEDFDTIFIREEAKRVFFLRTNTQSTKEREINMYDFNLIKGDTFSMLLRSWSGKDSFELNKLKVQFLYESYGRKHIVFDNGIQWIEGVGIDHLTYLFYAYNQYLFAPDVRCKTCVYYEGKVIYPFEGNCDSSVSIINDNSKKCRIFPSPTCESFSIFTENPNKHNIEIISASGQKIDEFILEGNTQYILSKSYPKGYYFVRIMDNNHVYVFRLLIK